MTKFNLIKSEKAASDEEVAKLEKVLSKTYLAPEQPGTPINGVTETPSPTTPSEETTNASHLSDLLEVPSKKRKRSSSREDLEEIDLEVAEINNSQNRSYSTSTTYEASPEEGLRAAFHSISDNAPSSTKPKSHETLEITKRKRANSI